MIFLNFYDFLTKCFFDFYDFLTKCFFNFLIIFKTCPQSLKMFHKI
ncbi:hypothetical protein M153_11300000334 [Pseudoloma neurophilia]|uniref:Uncharacterized protein n=1 Tax=Pseudoloma neurophilia TaxID=146866 RepID=A0A0R0LW42_9MICR|nr:hypothetical protein M153_11300000334 [Pseudoloma neurophilia]